MGCSSRKYPYFLLMSWLIVFLADYLVYVSLLGVAYLWVKGKRHDLIRIAVSMVLAFAVGEGINIFFSLPRPFIAHGTEPLISVPPSEYYSSFPSGHVMVMAAYAASVFFTRRWLGILLLVVAVVVGAARVVAGVHYPLDVLGGLLLGGGVAISVRWLHERYPFW